ncbi:MAG: hypothetical protein C4536_03370 [Actinobacteria bacterium]|jgi:hypothetical protein|nr:MAG: hypothetical protein C4536_03370 [Actinomycetota bacterium]
MRKVLIAWVVGATTCAAAASRLQPRSMLHPCDWSMHEEGSVRRVYRSLSHFLYHLRELMSVQAPISEVYLGRAISPAFRERIMLVTAYANECSW